MSKLADNDIFQVRGPWLLDGFIAYRYMGHNKSYKEVPKIKTSNTNDPHRMEGLRRCAAAMDPEDMPLFHFGEDPGVTDNDWWQ